MAANLASFAIHADDVDRARRFYAAVFGWEFEAWGPPGFYLIQTGTDDALGIQGILHSRDEPLTGAGHRGVEPTFAVDDVDAVTAAVEAGGGQITYPAASIPGVGVLLRFLDTEGNDIGAMEFETAPLT